MVRGGGREYETRSRLLTICSDNKLILCTLKDQSLPDYSGTMEEVLKYIYDLKSTYNSIPHCHRLLKELVQSEDASRLQNGRFVYSRGGWQLFFTHSFF